MQSCVYLVSYGLTVDELARHKHQSGLGWKNQDIGNVSGLSDSKHGRADSNMPNSSWESGFTGGDKAHNNIQPCKAVYVWVRAA